jgi:glycosyltransferase involved in cell wall biosynthesis
LKISIIIPVYNAEKYVRRCVESVLAQTFRDFEVILIDDGSTDKSGQYCDEYLTIDRRVKVFHQANGGPAKARNLGLDKAHGEFVTFIDADDWVLPEYLAAFFELSDGGIDADMIVQGVTFFKSPKDEWTSMALPLRKYGVEELGEFFSLTKLNSTLDGSWCKLLRREVIEKAGLRMDERLRRNEDVLFNMKFLCACSSATTVTATGNYIYNLDSETSLTKYLKTTLMTSVMILYDENEAMLLRYGFAEDSDIARFIRHQASMNLLGCVFLWLMDSSVSRDDKHSLIDKARMCNAMAAVRVDDSYRPSEAVISHSFDSDMMPKAFRIIRSVLMRKGNGCDGMLIEYFAVRAGVKRLIKGN